MYTPVILNEPGDMDGVRYMAGISDRLLSDAAIKSPALLPSVEAKMIITMPTYASLGIQYALLLRSAVTKITAAWALLSLPETEKSLDYSVTRHRDDQIKRLLDEAANETGKIPGTADPTYGPDNLVQLTGPTRTKKLTTTGDYAWIYESDVLV